MPKNRKKGGGSSSWQRAIGEKLSDVTLNDFANSAGRSGRLKKPASNGIVREVKKLCGSTDDDLAWYEKDIEDFDVDFSVDQENCDNGHLPTVKINKPKQKSKTTEYTLPVHDDKGMEYPLDIWYILSEYIKPEDIGTFSCICRSAQAVVNSPKFWYFLYKRYYSGEVTLPTRLQPDCMERPHSLRAYVIRALYFMYPPFMERIRCAVPFESEPHDLVSAYCLLMWYRKNRTVWNFYFKFQRGASSLTSRSSLSQPDLLEMLDDVHANAEEGCIVLQVTCLNFVLTPSVMGMYLASVNVNVGHKMHHHKLHLTFSTTAYSHPSARRRDISNTVITFDPVSNIRVLNWWNPHYPFNDT